MKPFVSIVVPVYNVEKELPRCVSSIIQQTFSNWELILVNDGSSDLSPAICDEYQKKDNRIRVIHQKNMGVSMARNVGMENVIGQWITFIDSDDYVTPDFLAAFVNECEHNHFDLFMGDVQQIGLNGETFVEYNLNDTLCGLKEAIVDYHILRSGDLHGKVFKRSIIGEELIFNKSIKYSEDGIFFDSFLSLSETICLNHTICYCYYRNSEGLSYKLNSFESEYEGYKEHKKVLKLIGERIDVDFRTLLHLSPIMRVMQSAVAQLDSTSFQNFCLKHDANDIYFISKYLKVLRLGNIIGGVYKKRMFKILYMILSCYYKIKTT